MAAMTTINTQALIIAHSNTLPTSADAALAPMALSGLPALSEFALATLRLIAYALRSTGVSKLIAEMQPEGHSSTKTVVYLSACFRS